ncbi:MAG: response regulator [Planctomycetes bacterium]|nr:response regulator [Planctomycetota bacterium]
MSPVADVLEAQQEIRILVVDDEPEIAALIAEALQGAEPSWYAEAEADSSRALERLSEAAFDCLITDLVMPDVDGLNLAEQARSANEHLALIAITGCGTVANSGEALRRGFDDFLEKPFDLKAMKAAVGRALAAHRQMDERDTRFAELAQAKTQLETANAQVQQKLDIASHDLVLSARRMARQLDELATRADVAQTLMGIIELEDLLGLCAELVGDRVPCRTCTVALYEPTEQAIGLMVRARPDSDDAPALSWLREPISAGVMCRAAQTGKAVHVECIGESNLLDDQERELWRDGRLLVVPVPLQGLTVGAVVLERAEEDGAFAAGDVKTVADLARIMAPAIRTAKAHHRQRCQIYASLEAIADCVERREEYLKGHSARVLAYAMPIGAALELAQAQIGALQIATRLHDIGRLGMPDSVVNHPGPLNDLQWDLVRRHPGMAADFLKPLDFFGEVGDIIRTHHESYDGTGYPSMKAGEEIPRVARILAVADAFDAMTSPRPYRDALDIDQAREQIRRLAGQQFDPAAAEAFLCIPVGVLAEIRHSHR